VFTVEKCLKCGCSPKGIITGEARARAYVFKCCVVAEHETIQGAVDKWNRMNKPAMMNVKVEGRLTL
jgi:hypothetical protein